ncbi:MAG: hypothetical protein AAF533_19335 [Acidobacteriota bacterium]
MNSRALAEDPRRATEPDWWAALFPKLVVLALLGVGPVLAREPTPMPPDWSQAPAEFAAGATAALGLPSGNVMLFSGKRGWYYQPEAGDLVEEPLEFDFDVHAAQAWDVDEVLLFSNDLVFLCNLEAGTCLEEQALLAYDLPEGWRYLDAAAWHDESRRIWFSGNAYMLFDVETGEREGPYPLTRLGLSESWRDIDAAVRTSTGLLTLFRKGRAIELAVDHVPLLVGKAGPVGASEDLEQLPRPTMTVRRFEPDFENLPGDYRDGFTAGVCVPGTGCLIFQRDHVLIYAADTAEILGDFRVGLPISAALRWSQTELALFSGRGFLVGDVDDLPKPGTWGALQDLGLPKTWEHVSAATVLDARRLLLVRGDEFFVYTLASGEDPPTAQGPLPLERLGWGFWEDGVDALMNHGDALIIVHRGAGWALMDTQDGQVLGPIPLIPETRR